MKKNIRSFTVCCALLISTMLSSSASVNKNARDALVVSQLTKYGSGKFKWLYKFLDANTVSMAQMFLSTKYRRMYTISPALLTRSRFKNKLKYMTNRAGTKAVDVILSLHGANEVMYFVDGATTTTQMKNDLRSLPKKNKLRMMYNLACYGASHRSEFIAGGFRLAIGAYKTNTASASEYPVFLTRFGAGHTVKNILKQTNNDPALKASDFAAGFMGFSNANSTKLTQGYRYLTLYSNPN